MKRAINASTITVCVWSNQQRKNKCIANAWNFFSLPPFCWCAGGRLRVRAVSKRQEKKNVKQIKLDTSSNTNQTTITAQNVSNDVKQQIWHHSIAASIVIDCFRTIYFFISLFRCRRSFSNTYYGQNHTHTHTQTHAFAICFIWFGLALVLDKMPFLWIFKCILGQFVAWLKYDLIW